MPPVVRRTEGVSLRVLHLFVTALLLTASGAFAQVRDLDAEPDSVDSITTESENPDSLTGHTEGIDSVHEGSLDSSIEGSEQIDRREAGAGEVDPRTVGSENVEGRDLGPSSIVGSEPVEQTSAQRLEAARAALRAAHARHEADAQSYPAATMPDTPAASQSESDRYAMWLARIDIARRRLALAQARYDVLDDAYAHMMRNDYPRGAERQKLIDERQAAKERLDSEQKLLPRIVDEARRDGVPPGVLEAHRDGSGS